MILNIQNIIYYFELIQVQEHRGYGNYIHYLTEDDYSKIELLNVDDKIAFSNCSKTINGRELRRIYGIDNICQKCIGFQPKIKNGSVNCKVLHLSENDIKILNGTIYDD